MMADLLKEVSILSAKVDRILALHQAADVEPDGTLDGLIHATYESMGCCTWTTAELISRAQHPDPAGLALWKAIQRTNKANARALGGYLSKRVPGLSHFTPDGLELARSGQAENVLCWHVNGVSNLKTQPAA